LWRGSSIRNSSRARSIRIPSSEISSRRRRNIPSNRPRNLRAYLSACRRLILPALLPLLFLLGCSSAARLQSSFGNKYRYSVSLVAPSRSSDLLFRDDHLIIQFRFDDPAIRFQAQNLSADTLRINWEKASLDVRGSSTPVRHLSTFYDSTAAASDSSPIPSLGVIRDVILPSRNVSFDGKQWRERDLLPTTDGHSLALRDSILNMTGATVSLILPLTFGSNVRSYRFVFSIDSVRQIAWNEYRLPAWLPPQPSPQDLKPTTGDQITAAIITSGFLGFFAYMLTLKKTPVVE
jgi:hypothetical protein